MGERGGTQLTTIGDGAVVLGDLFVINGSETQVRIQRRRTNKEVALISTMAQQFARCRASALSGLEGRFAVNNYPVVPRGTLHSPPLATRQVIFHIADPVWKDLKFLHVVDKHVSSSTLS